MKRSLVLIIIFLTIFSCEKDDLGVNPPDGNQSNGYYLYVGNLEGETIFVVDTDSNTVVDTLTGFGMRLINLCTTLSGGKLYITTGIAPAKVIAYNTRTRTRTIVTNDKVADVYLSPRGTPFIIASSTENQHYRELGTIDTVSDVATFIDTINIRNAGHNYQCLAFHPTRPVFYSWDSTNRLFAYDYDQREVVRVYQNIRGYLLLQMVVSNNGRYLYVAGGPVFDLERDSIVGSVGGNNLGSLALSPNGQYLYISDPGKYMIPEPVPSGKVYVYSTATMGYTGEIDFSNATLPNYPIALTDRIVLLPPDGRIAYVSGWLGLLWVVDVVERKILKTMDLRIFTTPLAVGRKP